MFRMTAVFRSLSAARLLPDTGGAICCAAGKKSHAAGARSRYGTFLPGVAVILALANKAAAGLTSQFLLAQVRCGSFRNLERLLARRPEGLFVNPFERGEIGPDLFRAACDMGLEGLVSKHRDAPPTRPHGGG